MLWLPALLSPQLLKPPWYPGICWPWNLSSQHGVKALILIFVLVWFGLTSCSWILPFNPTCVGGFVYFVSFSLYALPLSSCGLLQWYVISFFLLQGIRGDEKAMVTSPSFSPPRTFQGRWVVCICRKGVMLNIGNLKPGYILQHGSYNAGS